MVKTETSTETKLKVGTNLKKANVESAKKENKYEKLLNKKRKANTDQQENVRESAKKPRLENKPLKKNLKPYQNGQPQKKAVGTKKNGTVSHPLNRKEKKDLKMKRKQKKLANTYDMSINIKKIWEALRKSETTDETRKKLCSSLYEQVKGKICQVSCFALRWT